MIPESIPLDRRHRPLLHQVTAFSPATLHRIHAQYPILVARGTGCGRRYYLHVPSYREYERLHMRSA